MCRSLKDGEPWQKGFVQGLNQTLVFVPLVTWDENGNGAVGQMAWRSSIPRTGGKDWVDNVLLEYELALVLKEARDAKHPGALLASILPIIIMRCVQHSTRSFLCLCVEAPQPRSQFARNQLNSLSLHLFSGGKDERGFLPFPFPKIKQLAAVPSAKTKHRLAELCKELGLPLSTQAKERSVRQVVEAILENQGASLHVLGSPQVATDAAIVKVFDKSSKVLFLKLSPDLSFVVRLKIAS